MLNLFLRDKFSTLPPITKKSLVLSLFDGSFALLHVNLVGGAFITGFALYLGATEFQIALIFALPMIAQCVQMISAYIEERIPRRKMLVSYCTLLSRQCCLLFPLIPLLTGDSSLRITLFLSIIIFSGIISMMSVNIWQSWMADVVPEAIWGSYFGLRTMCQNLTVMLGIYVFSLIMDLLQSGDHDQASYTVLFLSASLSAMIAFCFLIRIHEPIWHPHRIHSFKELIGLPLTNQNYKRVLIFSAIWGIAIGFSMPFFSAHMLMNLKMSYSMIAIYSILVTLTSLFAYPLWGKIIDHSGAKPVLKISIVWVGALPLLWLLATAHFLIPIWIDAILTGIFWAAINLASFNLILSTSQKEHRSIYLAMYSAVTGIATFMGSGIGGLIAQSLSNWHFNFWGQNFVNFHCLFLISTVSRWISMFYLNSIIETKAKSVYETLSLFRIFLARSFWLLSALLGMSYKKP